MSKPQFRPIAPLDVDDAALDLVNETLGVPTMVRPQQQAVTPPNRRAVKPQRRQKKLTIHAPEPVIDALKLDALTQRSTVRTLILIALKDKGYPIVDEDLLPGAGGSD